MCRHIIIKDHYNSSNHFTTVKNHGDRWLDQWQQQVFCSVRLNFRVTAQLNHAGKILRKSNKMIRRSWIRMANHKRAKWNDWTLFWATNCPRSTVVPKVLQESMLEEAETSFVGEQLCAFWQNLDCL